MNKGVEQIELSVTQQRVFDYMIDFGSIAYVTGDNRFRGNKVIGKNL